MLGSALLAILLPLPLPLSAAPPPPVPQADAGINKLLEPIRKKHDVPALAAAVVRGKGLVAVGAVGVRKRGSDAAVTVHDRFHLGSNTKALTAVLIARLVEAGKLQWETTLEKAFPELADAMPPDLRKVTLTHLLTHRSGLPQDFAGEDGWAQFTRAGTVRKQREAAVKKALAEKLAAKPGEQFVYSNIGYVVAAAVAERTADATWEDLIARTVFEPLGMKSAGFGPMGAPGKLAQPWQHTDDGKPVEPVPEADNPPVMGPAGRVHASLPDWARFIADQLKGARGDKGLLQAATYKQLHTASPRDSGYAPGAWKIVEAGGLRFLGHDGSNTMNYATALLVPEKDLAVLVATNQGGPAGPGEKACQEAAVALVKEWLPK